MHGAGHNDQISSNISDRLHCIPAAAADYALLFSHCAGTQKRSTCCCHDSSWPQPQPNLSCPHLFSLQPHLPSNFQQKSLLPATFHTPSQLSSLPRQQLQEQLQLLLQHRYFTLTLYHQ
jgi:hypothetical protein